MNISEEIGKLTDQLNINTESIYDLTERNKTIKAKLRKLEALKKKGDQILGEGQKGAAE